MTISNQVTPRPKLVRAGRGETTHVVGRDRLTFMFTGEDTDGAFVLGLVTVEPGGGPPLHVHRREDEVFIMLEGEIEAWTPAGWQILQPGDVAFLPADTPHSYRSAAGGPAQFYVFANPAGIEDFYAQLAQLFTVPGGLKTADIAVTAEEHGITFLPISLEDSL